MTNEEAKEWLKAIKGKYIHGGDEGFDAKRKEAISMAIKALDQEPCGDAISRQAVLDLAKKGFLVSNGNYESVCKAINDLPSVNPTKTGDLISKDKVIDILDYWYDKDSDGYVQACKSISELQ